MCAFHAQFTPTPSLRLIHTSSTLQLTLMSVLQAMRGTPCYMAPELYSDGSTHSTASDLWSLGCVLYECSVGTPPFMNTSFNVLMQQILNEEPPPVPGRI